MIGTESVKRVGDADVVFEEKYVPADRLISNLALALSDCVSEANSSTVDALEHAWNVCVDAAMELDKVIGGHSRADIRRPDLDKFKVYIRQVEAMVHGLMERYNAAHAERAVRRGEIGVELKHADEMYNSFVHTYRDRFGDKEYAIDQIMEIGDRVYDLCLDIEMSDTVNAKTAVDIIHNMDVWLLSIMHRAQPASDLVDHIISATGSALRSCAVTASEDNRKRLRGCELDIIYLDQRIHRLVKEAGREWFYSNGIFVTKLIRDKLKLDKFVKLNKKQIRAFLSRA